MKNLIKSRRGIAIEMAIGAMFIMIALSIVLISISGMQTKHMNNDLNEFNEKIEINEIGEYVCKNRNEYNKTETERQDIIILNTETTENVDTGYDVQYIDSQYKIYNGDEVVLIIGIDENGKITSWGN